MRRWFISLLLGVAVWTIASPRTDADGAASQPAASAPAAGAPAPVETLTGLEWLAGDWTTEPGVQLCETWSAPLGDAMVGSARVVVRGRTVSTRGTMIRAENGALSLYWREGDERMGPKPPDLGRVKVYRQSSRSEREITFENAAEDHPRRVRFEHRADGRLQIDFVGLHDTKLHTQTYAYKRRAG